MPKLIFTPKRKGTLILSKPDKKIQQPPPLLQLIEKPHTPADKADVTA